MSERDGYEPGVPCWVATIQPDPEAAAAFYGELFGWDYEDGGGFFVAPAGQGRCGGGSSTPRPGPTPTARLDHGHLVDSADDAADIPTGRTAVLADPAGATFSVTQINPAR